LLGLRNGSSLEAADLLETVIEAHGGLARWNQLKTVSARIVQGGALWGVKGQKGVLDDVFVTASLHEERVSHHPFGADDRRSAFTPERVAIRAPSTVAGMDSRTGRRQLHGSPLAGIRVRQAGEPAEATMKGAMRTLIVAGLVVAASEAHAKTKDQKLCSDLAEFRNNVSDLQQMGPQSTMGELRKKEDQLSATEKRIAKRAKHDKHARELHAAIDDLNRTVKRLPNDTTLASAQESIHGKVTKVADAADSFNQSYCSTGQ
jgi:hypothetical protein